MSKAMVRIPGKILALVLVASASAIAVAQGELPPAIAEYQIRRGKRIERLEVVRSLDRVEHRYLDREITEVWQRSPDGELEHWKVFPGQHRSVHYTPGDLRTVHMAPAWEQLATLVDPDQRAALKPVRTRRGPRGMTRLLMGTVDGQPARVLWNEQRGWAEEITLGAVSQRTSFSLLSSEPCTDERCRPSDLTALREIEFADLGDSERDPFVRRFLASFTGHTH